MDDLAKLLLLQGKVASLTLPLGAIDNLSEVEFSVSSQFGEDGIIEWLVQHISPRVNKFIEFGVESFQESNCKFLLENRNWKGLILDSNPDYIDSIETKDFHWMHNLKARCSFITRDNINGLISDNGFGGDVGLLSIDLDGNDYWVWERVEACRPDIVICEYNGILGDLYPLSVPYRNDFNRFKAHYCGRYFGASLPALKHLADSKGYEFIGTTSNGLNAFFATRPAAEKLNPILRAKKGFPNLLRNTRDQQGALVFLNNIRAIFDLISHLPVIDIRTGECVVLESFSYPYSDEWLSQLD